MFQNDSLLQQNAGRAWSVGVWMLGGGVNTEEEVGNLNRRVGRMCLSWVPATSRRILCL